MSKVWCDVDFTDVENDAGRDVPGVKVTCQKCGHSASAYGQADGSVRRCFVILKEECPRGESNYYLEGQRSGTKTPKAVAPTRSPGGRNEAVHFNTSSKPIATGAVPRLIADNKFAVFETETTGLSTEKDQIVQVGIIQIDHGAPRWRMTCNVKPTCPVQPRAAEAHGLDETRLFYAPPFNEIANSLVAKLEGRVILGYNCAKFDMPILERQLATSGLTDVPQFRALDVLILERRFAKDHPELVDAKTATHRLADAAVRWGVAVDPTRDSIANAKMVWGVFVELCTRFPELGDASLIDALELQAAEQALTGMGLRTGRPGAPVSSLF